MANSAISATLRPVKEDETSPSGEDASGKPYISSGSVDFDTTQNLYIEGDNLKVLKLLRETYFGKVKMIYIDPPYNTGNDFVYEDDFTIKSDEWSEKSGDYDEEGNRLVKNLESNGRFHTDWLNMIYPRLRLARDLLTDDGVIFISIDDNEQANLKKICDEAFGESNFVAQIVWEKVHTRKNSAVNFSVSHDYIMCYAKLSRKTAQDLQGFYRNMLPRENTDAYKNPDGDPRGDWKLDPIYANNPYDADYTITKPNGIVLSRPEGRYWRYSKATIDQAISEGRIVWGSGNSYPMIKRYLAEVADGLVPVTLFTRDFAGDNMKGSAEIDELFHDKKIFSYPKPSLLIKRLLQIGSNKDSIILDFFSGSATAAHAVMQLNAEDGGNRKFIMVQLPEPCDEQSEAFKAGYKNICEIGKERIRRAGRKILELSLESLEKEGVIEKYAGKLSEIRSLEEVYGAGGTSLSADKPVAKRGNVCLSRPNATGSGFNSVEYSRRTGSGDTGIYPIFESGEGLTSGAGNTIVTMRSLEILNTLGYRVCVECIRGDQQNDIFSDYTSKLQALNSKLSLDTGFRVLKLDSSNMQDVYYNPQKILQTLLDATIDNVKPDRSPLDLLFQVMLELGVPLSAKIEEKQVGGKTYYAVNGNDFIACFDNDIDEDVITAIAKEQPLYAAFKDKSFATDSVAINNEQLFKTYSPITKIKVV